jgi:hypothetical protein
MLALLVTLCPRCRSPVLPDARFCSECGTWVIHEPPTLDRGDRGDRGDALDSEMTPALAGTLPASYVEASLRAAQQSPPPPEVAVRARGPGSTQFKTAPVLPGAGPPAVGRAQARAMTGHEGFTAVDRAVPVAPTPAVTPESPTASKAGRTVVDDRPLLTPSRSSGRTPRPLGGFLVSYQYEPLGTFWPLALGPNLVGRAGGRPDLEVGIADSTVSGEQAVIEVGPTSVTVTDKESRNGTWVNGQRLPSGAPVPLAHGDKVRFGSFETMMVIVPYPPGS